MRSRCAPSVRPSRGALATTSASRQTPTSRLLEGATAASCCQAVIADMKSFHKAAAPTQRCVVSDRSVNWSQTSLRRRSRRELDDELVRALRTLRVDEHTSFYTETGAVATSATTRARKRSRRRRSP